MKRFPILMVMAVGVLAFSLYFDGCKEKSPSEPPVEGVEHPPPTTVTFVLFDSTGVTVVDSCMVRDTTQVHGKPQLIGQLDLVAGRTYKGTIRLYDETTTPTTTVTGDIISERDAHLFQYQATDTNRVKVTNTDLDSKGLTFGINFTIRVSSGSPASGMIHVILQHHDDGIKFNTNGTYHEPYDLDVDTDFPYAITQ